MSDSSVSSTCSFLCGVALSLASASVMAQSTPMQATAEILAMANEHEAVAAATLTLPRGELKTIPVRGKIARIAVGNGKVVTATTVDNRLLLIAEQVGSTQVMVWSSQGVQSLRVNVVHPDLDGVRKMLQDIVDRNQSLRLSEVDKRLVVSGVAHKPVIDQLDKIAADVPGVLVNVEQDQGESAKQTILFRMHFIEVKKSLLENIGIRWDSSMNGPIFGVQGSTRSGIYRNVQPAPPNTDLLAAGRPFYSVGGANGGSFLGIASTLASKINLGISDGDVRVLASPELTAKSSGSAKLQVGGEVPIPQAGPFGAVTVEFKPYGILFDISPSVDADGVISAKLSTEISQIDPAVTVQGIPGFLTRATSTEVSLRSGDVFALSGLVSGELSNAIDKVPGLGNIPIMGRLFSSDDFRNQRTDLVVLVEAEVVKPGAGISQEMKGRGLRNIDEFRELSQQRSSSGGRRPLEKEVPLPPLGALQPGEAP